MAEPAYKRIMLKLSGEAIGGENGQVINFDVVGKICDQIIQVVQMGIEVGIVIGAGNIWRGRQGTNMDRTTADYMGMLATGINALALQDAMEQRGVPTRVLSAIEMRAVAEPYKMCIRDRWGDRRPGRRRPVESRIAVYRWDLLPWHRRIS